MKIEHFRLIFAKNSLIKGVLRGLQLACPQLKWFNTGYSPARRLIARVVWKLSIIHRVIGLLVIRAVSPAEQNTT